MNDIPVVDKSKKQSLREEQFWLLVLVVIGMLCFGYWTLYHQPAIPESSEQKAASEERFKAWYAVKYCRERLEALPAGSGEAQIAQGACELLQKEYDQKR